MLARALSMPRTGAGPGLSLIPRQRGYGDRATRLGLSVLDVLTASDAAQARAGPGHHRARALASGLAGRVLDVGDGYAARDLLAHTAARKALTSDQTDTLTTTVIACGLDQEFLPGAARTEVDDALDTAEHVILTAGPDH